MPRKAPNRETDSQKDRKTERVRQDEQKNLTLEIVNLKFEGSSFPRSNFAVLIVENPVCKAGS